MAENEDLSQEVTLFRSRFQEKYSADIENKVYDDPDIERLLTDSKFTERFILHQKKDVEKAIMMADVSLKWRKSMSLNDLTEQSFPSWMHELGGLFYYKTDKNGNSLLHFQVGKCKRDPNNTMSLKKFIAWWIDKSYKKTPENSIVLLMDMTGARLSNMDIDIIKFLVTCFTTYFPYYLEYMLIYEMPWVLNAIWKIIKNLLTEEQQKRVLFIKKAEMPKYVHLEDVFVHMGGTDNYKYHYMPSEDSGIDIPNEDISLASDEFQSDASNLSLLNGVRHSVSMGDLDKLHKDLDKIHSKTMGNDIMLPEHAQHNHFSTVQGSLGTSLRKRVTFAENTPEEDNSVSATVHDGGDANVPTYMGTIVSISPGDQLVFNVTDEQKETVDILNIRNVHTKTVAFKVKTTNPNNYRVRPSTSLIKPGETASVNIYLQPGAYDTIDRDKFLIMVMEVNDNVVNASEISSQWKLRPAENMYMEHRLYCIMKQVRFEDKLQNGSVRDTMAEDLQVIRQKVEVLLGQQIEMEQNMAKIFKAVVLLVVVVFVALALFVFAYVYQAVEDDKLLTECRGGNA